jgi:hypothetical protein
MVEEGALRGCCTPGRACTTSDEQTRTTAVLLVSFMMVAEIRGGIMCKVKQERDM